MKTISTIKTNSNKFLSALGMLLVLCMNVSFAQKGNSVLSAASATASFISPPTLCINVPYTFTNTSLSATNYTWFTTPSTGAIIANQFATNASITFTAPGIYVVNLIALNSGFPPNSYANTTVTVSTSPIVFAFVNPPSVCPGGTVAMVATGGATSYSWSTGATVQTTTAMPTGPTVYTVTGTTGGCSTSTTVAVAINPTPTVVVTSSAPVLCVGQTATLTAAGAITYSWSTGSVLPSTTVSPTSTTIYTVVGTNTLGCKSTQLYTQPVSACTGITAINETSTNFNVYPNPSNGDFFVEITKASKITVLNSLGGVVYENNFEEGKHQISLEKLASGIYFVQAKDNDVTKTIKLIKR